VILEMAGSPALSQFRLDKLTSALRERDSRVRRLGARYQHFVEVSRAPRAGEQAVLERLLATFTAPLASLSGAPVTQARILEWLEATVRQHHANPNLARLLQHAALSGGPQTGQLIDRLFRPMFQPGSEADMQEEGISQLQQAGLQPWAVMAFNNLVMSYVTMAPMYRDLLGQDPFSETALENQLTLVKTLLRAVLEYRGR